MGGSGFLACLSRSAAFSSCFINLDEMRKDALSHYPSRVYLQRDFKDKEILILKLRWLPKSKRLKKLEINLIHIMSIYITNIWMIQLYKIPIYNYKK